MTRFTIRDAVRSDIPALIRVEAASFDSDRISPRSLRRLVGSHAAACRVAGDGAGPAAYSLLFFRHGTRVARLYSLAVDPERRGAGLATALLADAARIARKRGCDRLRLEVREDNKPAIRLYARHGWRPIGRYRSYYADGADALRYEKQLAAGRAARVVSDEDRSPRDSIRAFHYIGPVNGANPAKPRQAAAAFPALAEPASPLRR